MAGYVWMGPAGLERVPLWPGQWVTYLGEPMAVQGPQQPDPITDIVADLVRRFDPGGYRLGCPVAGCRWRLDVPRMELDPTLVDVDTDGSGYTVYVEGVPREDLEQQLAAHLDWHARLTETVRSWLAQVPADQWPLPQEPGT